ncbi:MAG: hypothetical protein M1838_005013 [Thelocarpon superellum]|nr:MAG: hypothetical protein M1838_005013 [Thelocarpon superellum]
MQNRIDRLEGLVLSLMTNGAQSAGPVAATAALATQSDGSLPDQSNGADDDDMIKEESDEDESDVDRVTSSFGVMKVDATRSMYFGGAHWATIMDDITEVKTYFAEHRKQIEDQMAKVNASQDGDESKGPAILFSTAAPPERSELFAALPPRPAVDKIISRYFNSFDPAIYIIHGPTFRKEVTTAEDYEAHWADPSKTPVIWLGQLFAILCLAMQAFHREGDEPPEYKGKAMTMANTFRKRTAECVALEDFCKPISNMIETLILHAHGEFTRSRDSDVGVWVTGGMITRLAMRMGYHRDPKHFPSIGAYRGEMRRRVWTFVRQLDVLFSFQIGLPGMIRSVDCDTGLPRNIYDDEFGEGIAELPPSRPVTEPTPVSYMIAKARMAFQFGSIIEQTNLLCANSYEDVMKLDQGLQETRAKVPPHLQLRPMDEMRLDPANLIMQRFGLDLLYQKGLCVLHRKFLTSARVNPRYAHSRQACVNASMEILRHQATLNREARPGGRLRSIRSYVSSMTSHDFLLAAMILCLDVYYHKAEEGGKRSPRSEDAPDPQVAKVQALETSKQIWGEAKDCSIEAYKAYTTLSIMLEKLDTARATTAAAPLTPMSFAVPGSTPAMSDGPAPFDGDSSKPEHSAALTLGLMSTGGMTPNTASIFDRATSSTPSNNVTMTEATPFSPNFAIEHPNQLGQISSGPPLFPAMGVSSMDVPVNLDWDAFDSYVQDPSLDPTNQFWPNGGMDFSISSAPSTTIPTTSAPSGTGPPPFQDMQGNGYLGGDGVFMGVNTPPGNNNM